MGDVVCGIEWAREEGVGGGGSDGDREEGSCGEVDEGCECGESCVQGGFLVVAVILGRRRRRRKYRGLRRRVHPGECFACIQPGK